MVTAKHGPMKIGIVGAGAISNQYLRNLTQFADVNVLAIGNRTESRSLAQAAKYGVPTSGGIDVVINHPEIELVVNLTTPSMHAPISKQVLLAGKHVWSEKPIGLNRFEAQELLVLAKSHGLRVGVAPDTVLGLGFQTAKRAIARGDIGQPLFAQTVFQWQGPEIFHPNPAFLYEAGAGRGACWPDLPG